MVSGTFKFIIYILAAGAVGIGVFIFDNYYLVIAGVVIFIIMLAWDKIQSGESGKDTEKHLSRDIEKLKKQLEKEKKDEKTEEANEAAANEGLEQAKQLQAQENVASSALVQDLQKNSFIITIDNLPGFLKETERLGGIIKAKAQWSETELTQLEIENSALIEQLTNLEEDKKELKESEVWVSKIVGNLKMVLSAKLAEMGEAINHIDSILKQKLQIIPIQNNELKVLKENALKSLQFLKEVHTLLKEGKGGEAKAFLDSTKNAEYAMAQNFAKFQELQNQIFQLSANLDSLYQSRKKLTEDFNNIYQSYVSKQTEAAQKNAA